MDIRCVVLDFDGTFTDVEVEAADFESCYQADVAALLEREIADTWREEKAEIAAHPGKYGWVYGGVVVAPANADPYIRTTSVAQRVLDRFGALKDPAARNETVQGFYRRAYQRTKTAFRSDAREVLEALLATNLPVFIVTNAHTDMVERKLATLAPAGRERLGIRGEARKFVLGAPAAPDARFTALPETKRLPGLERPLYLRRGAYYEVLSGLWRSTGTTPAQTLLCGDIYELDLAMPAELGVQIHLVAGRGVAPYERDAVLSLGERGGVSDSLRPILARLRS